MGRLVPLKLGFIGVVLRSQEDIQKGLQIREALKREKEFFQRSLAYRQISSKCGNDYLSRTLNKLLMNHIRDCLPELKDKIGRLLSETQRELDAYGTSAFHNSSKGGYLLELLTKFTNDYKTTIEGTSGNLNIHELYGGARINYIFTDIYTECMNRIGPLDGLTTNDIRTAIRNASGTKTFLFVPEAAFELLVRKQIRRLEAPSLQCVDLVFDELQRTINLLDSKEMMRFMTLKERVIDVTGNLLRKCRVPTKQIISDLIAIQISYINTTHPDFVGGGGTFYQVYEKLKMNSETFIEGVDGNYSSFGPKHSTQNRTPKNPSSSSPPPKGQLSQAQHPYGKQQQGQLPAVPAGSPRPPKPEGRMDRAPPMQAGSSVSFPNVSQRREEKRLPPTPRAVGFHQRSFEKLAPVPTQIIAGKYQSGKDTFECELIKTLMSSYFEIVKESIQDLTPKTIVYFLVNKSKEAMQNELVASLYVEENFDELLEESPVIAEKRTQCLELIKMLSKSTQVLNDVRDFSIA